MMVVLQLHLSCREVAPRPPGTSVREAHTVWDWSVQGVQDLQCASGTAPGGQCSFGQCSGWGGCIECQGPGSGTVHVSVHIC